MTDDFHGYELLLLRRLQNDPVLCFEWVSKLQNKLLPISDEEYLYRDTLRRDFAEYTNREVNVDVDLGVRNNLTVVLAP